MANIWQSDRFMLVCWIFWVPFSITLHELGHGWAALWEGDDTPKHLNHMTWDPFVHMGGMSWLVFALVGIAWGAMPVNPLRFRHRIYGDAIVSVAGPVMNLGLTLVCGLALAIVTSFFWESAGEAWFRNLGTFLSTGGFLNDALFLFNLVPIPPLDGSRILACFSRPYRHFIGSPHAQQLSMFAFLLLFFVGGRYIFRFGLQMFDGYVSFVASFL